MGAAANYDDITTTIKTCYTADDEGGFLAWNECVKDILGSVAGVIGTMHHAMRDTSNNLSDAVELHYTESGTNTYGLVDEVKDIYSELQDKGSTGSQHKWYYTQQAKESKRYVSLHNKRDLDECQCHIA